MNDGRGKATSLADLEAGSAGRVLALEIEGHVRNRLIEQGMTIGQKVTVRRKAPLGGPIAVELRGYHLALRLAEARLIQIEPLIGDEQSWLGS